MKCKLAKSRIALLVGDDLDSGSKKELKVHLSACPPCRQYWQEMKSSLLALHDPAGDLSDPPNNSVWPRVASRLPRRAPRQGHSRFHGWMAASSVAAACCVLIAYGITYQSPNTSHTLAVPGTMFDLPGGDGDGPETSIQFRPQESHPNSLLEGDNSKVREMRLRRELEKLGLR